MKNDVKTSLSKYLSVCGIASRRKSCDLIRLGKVKVNQEIIKEPGFKISPQDKVCFEGKELLYQKKVYIMLNKPRGCICTNDDPHAPKKAIDLIELPAEYGGLRIFSAGRLDKDSEGLLIFTNDGDYTEKLMHPKHKVLKTYKVETSSRISDSILNQLRAGIKDDGEFLHPKEVIRETNCLYTFILNEGKKREIRRMINFAGTDVESLKRVSIGQLTLEALKPGQWKFLSEDEANKALK